jgi:hypothetical protein
LVGKLRERDHLEYWGIWKYNIKMALQEVEWGGGADWIVVAQDKYKRWALTKAMMKFRVP